MKENERYIIIQIPPEAAGVIMTSIDDTSMGAKMVLEKIFSSFKAIPSVTYDKIDETHIVLNQNQNFSSNELSTFRQKIKKDIAININSVFELLTIKLHSESKLYDDMIALYGRFNRAEKEYNLGRIDFTQREMVVIQVTTALTYMVNDFTESDINL